MHCIFQRDLGLCSKEMDKHLVHQHLQAQHQNSVLLLVVTMTKILLRANPETGKHVVPLSRSTDILQLLCVYSTFM